MEVFTGKNLEELLQTVANKKNTTVDKLVYTVTEEKKGFLGLGGEVSATVYCEQDIQDFMKAYLDTYFENIEMEVEVTVESDNGFYRITLNGENNAILIGRNGQTLQSLNNILKSAASSEFKRRIGLLIDVNGYKEEKYQKICALAGRVAKTVQRTKTDATLDPMPADERKAIHNYLTNMKYVSTVSEGEGSQRRIKLVYNPGKEEN
ncbi:MAG: R3H domain-containing nucleic acid-binding protein [Longicatena sp.]